MIPVRRIAYVLKIFPKISETFVLNEIAELRRRGTELRILSLLPPREQIAHSIVDEKGLQNIVCYSPRDFSRIVEDFSPQLIHAHFATESAATALSLAAAHGLPFTFTSHGYDIYRKPPPDYHARAAAASGVVTVSRANADYIQTAFSVPEEKVRVIPCGVDLSRFSPEAKNGHSELPLILCVARLVAVKNLGLLLRGCAVVHQHGMGFRCLLVGDGPCHQELLALRSELGLDQVVEFAGAAEHAEVLRYWRKADIGVLTSVSEGMPVSLMEAAACGVPVVATAVGGIPELVADAQTGFLVPNDDPAALAARLEQLLGDQPLRRAMGKAARARAEQRFSLGKQVDSLLELWSEVLRRFER